VKTLGTTRIWACRWLKPCYGRGKGLNVFSSLCRRRKRLIGCFYAEEFDLDREWICCVRRPTESFLVVSVSYSQPLPYPAFDVNSTPQLPIFPFMILGVVVGFGLEFFLVLFSPSTTSSFQSKLILPVQHLNSVSSKTQFSLVFNTHSYTTRKVVCYYALI
jgi:hypothetical protein